jgi:8-oxo-dGTP pyrophosphatase MutT (NUDIX family)
MGPRPDRRQGSQRQQGGNRHYHAALAAGGIIYRKRAGHVEIFFIKDPYQRWTFPKGRREAGENLTQTAIREVKEETGLEGLRVIAPVGQSKFSFRRNGVVIDRSVLFFLFEAPLTAKEKLTGEGGIWEGKWVRAHQVFDANGYRNLDRLLSKALRIISYEERKTRGFSAKNPSSFGATTQGQSRPQQRPPQNNPQPFRSRRPRIIT